VEVILGVTLTGLASASSLFLVASGLSVIFGVTRIVNFAHGSLFMLGAYLGWTAAQLLPRTPLGLLGAVLLAGIGTAVLGVLLERLVLRRLRDAPELMQLLATFGVVLVLADATLAIWGPSELALSRPAWLRAAVPWGELRIPLWDMVLIGVGPLVLLGLTLLFRATRFGLLVRAATEDGAMLASLGVDQARLFTLVFALGAGLAGIGGALSLPQGSANLGLDLATVAEAFVVVVVGGLGSVPGAFLAALLIGQVHAWAALFLPEAALGLSFLVMAVVLAVRPRGLLGVALGEPRAAAPPPRLRPWGVAPRIVVGAALAGLALLPFGVGPHGLAVATEMAVLALFAASLQLLMGPGGMGSFGHAGFFGLGAYATAWAHQAGAPIPVELLGAASLAALAALPLGALALRLGGVYLAMLTLAFAQILWALSIQWVEVTGGDNGILGVWHVAPWNDPKVAWWIVLGVVVATLMGVRGVVLGRPGLLLRAVRDAPERAAASGLRVSRIRLWAFVSSAAIAGLAGGLYVQAKGSVFPTYLAIANSVDGLVMVLIGGLHVLSGPVLGAVALVGLQDLFSRQTDLWRGAIGLVVVLLVLLLPDGLGGIGARLRRS